MSHFRRITAMRTRIALDNPGATDHELDGLFNAELASAGAEGRFDNPYFVGLDEDEPKDHAYNDQPWWAAA